MADRYRLRGRTGVVLAAAALALSGLTATAVRDDSVSARPGTAGVPAADGTSAVAADGAAARAGADEIPPLGAFTDSGPEGVAALADLQSWLGGTPVRVAHTYLPGDSWQGIEGEDAQLAPWAQWTRARSGRMFVLNVPMQEDDEGGVSDADVRALIDQGARGADDAHFTALARRLVRLGVPDTVIVLGWEMNGVTYTHRCGPDPAGWKEYWNRIVAAMRAVPGQHFRFDFAPSRGQDAIPWTECYPGDGVVDVIGMDSYDQPAGESFYDQVTEPYGLQEQVDFAGEHGKPVSYPEWGLFQNGDDPDWMTLMLTWINTHHALYQTLTDYCPHGIRECDQNPQAAKVYRIMLYGRQTASAPPPIDTSAPSTGASDGPSAAEQPAASPAARPAGPSPSPAGTPPHGQAAPSAPAAVPAVPAPEGTTPAAPPASPEPLVRPSGGAADGAPIAALSRATGS